MIIVSQLITRAYYSFYWLNIFTHCFVTSESFWKYYWERLNHGVSEFSQEHGAKGDGHLDWEFSSRPCRPSHPVSYLYCKQYVLCIATYVKCQISMHLSFFRHLDSKLGNSSVYHKTNRETMVEIRESVRGKDVYIIQTGSK